jgi:ABC-2 type transport system permease protein
MYGGAISGSTGEYLQFILPGTLVMSVLFTTVYSGVALNTDMTKGVVDRFRSLAISPAAPLVGAVLGDSVRYLVAGTVVVIVGVILGYSPPGGVDGVLAAMLLVVVFAFGLAWVFTTFGMLMLFISNAFVPPETLPSAIEAFVDINPASHLVTGARTLMDGTAEVGDILLVLAEAAVLTAVFAPLTMRLYRSRT